MRVGICYCVGSRNLKTIKGRTYLYYVISEEGKKRAMYCGPASKPESERRAIDYEITEFKRYIKLSEKKIAKLERQKLRL